MNGKRVLDYLALGVFVLWVAGVLMILAGIWMPSWQWIATGILSVVLGTVGAWVAADE